MGLFIILMGAQGAGKGVQAQYLSETYHIPQVSTGDLFRAMKSRQDALAKRVQEIMNAGKLVDDDTTNEVLADRLAQADAQAGAILDGYPRNSNQADFLAQYLAQKGEKVNGVFLLEIDLYVAFKRAFGRFTAASGESYNIYYRNEGLTVTHEDDPTKTYPPRIVAKIDATGEVLQRRPDDANAAAIVKRIDTYLEQTQPLIDYYDTRGLLQRINADQPIDAVTYDLNYLINKTKTE